MTENTNPSSYLEEMKRLQKEALQELLTQARTQKEYQIKQADAAKKETNRAVNQSYLQYIDPYGVQSESLADAGLSYSGVAESNYAKGYNAYQNAFASSAGTAQAAKDEANMTYLNQLAQGNAQKLSIEADYYDKMFNDAWNQKQYDYYNNKLNEA